LGALTEKRRFRRTPSPIPVKISDGTRVMWECVENISRGGAYIRGTRVADRRDRLDLSFTFPGLADPILLSCRVVRRDADGIGVHFVPYPVGPP
jgi:hypothetical protein